MVRPHAPDFAMVLAVKGKKIGRRFRRFVRLPRQDEATARLTRVGHSESGEPELTTKSQGNISKQTEL